MELRIQGFLGPLFAIPLSELPWPCQKINVMAYNKRNTKKRGFCFFKVDFYIEKSFKVYHKPSYQRITRFYYKRNIVVILKQKSFWTFWSYEKLKLRTVRCSWLQNLCINEVFEKSYLTFWFYYWLKYHTRDYFFIGKCFFFNFPHFCITLFSQSSRHVWAWYWIMKKKKQYICLN